MDPIPLWIKGKTVIRPEGQFQNVDSPEVRKLIFRLLDELGHGLPEMEAAERRARWLRQLIRFSENGFALKDMLVVSPLAPVAAYNAFVAIVGVLGVPIKTGIECLEEEIRRRPKSPHDFAIRQLQLAKAECI